jgi:hypothetical protein
VRDDFTVRLQERFLRNLVGGEENEQPHDDRRDIFDLIQTIGEGMGLPLGEGETDPHCG